MKLFKRCGLGVCLALRSLVYKVKRTLTIAGSWIGVEDSLCRQKHGLILGPRNKIWYSSYTLLGRAECVRCVHYGRGPVKQ